jgi:hypothetical protein
MCSYYLVEPVACTPASGWEKGQVENQVGVIRERFFTLRLRFKNYDELNAWLLDQCVVYAEAHRHPELSEQTIWDVYEAERLQLVPYAGRFDGFHAVPASVSKTCLVRFDNNKYSVTASASRLRRRRVRGRGAPSPARPDPRKISGLGRATPRRRGQSRILMSKKRPAARLTARSTKRLLHLVFESHRALGADSEEKREPVSDIDTAAADSLKVLDPKRPIREADIAECFWYRACSIRYHGLSKCASSSGQLSRSQSQLDIAERIAIGTACHSLEQSRHP